MADGSWATQPWKLEASGGVFISIRLVCVTCDSGCGVSEDRRVSMVRPGGGYVAAAELQAREMVTFLVHPPMTARRQTDSELEVYRIRT